MLFQETLEPLGGGASLEEESPWGGAGTEVLTAQPAFLSAAYFGTVDATGPAAPCSFPHHDGACPFKL